MCRKQNCKSPFFRILLATVMLILLTRMVTLTHNRQLHPDEHVFYLTVNSLSDSILNGSRFVENKEYPEGAYYFQLPFQMAGQIARNLLGIEGTKGLQHFGRLASVVYFAIAVGLGLRLIRRYFSKTRAILVLYGLTMCFSLFFLEQSRYGTGDMITMMLLMLLLTLTGMALEPGGKGYWWPAAFFVGGILGAVKYPQLVFCLIPLTAFLFQPAEKKGRKLALFLLAVVAGFFLFSPKAMLDPAYVLRVIQRESGAYAGSSHDMGGTANHILTLGLYLLLYSDFPLLPMAALAGLGFRLVRLPRIKDSPLPVGTALLFEAIVPGVCLFFLAYNLFVPVLFFRTLIPFFTILALYTAKMTEELFCKNKWGRAAVLILAGMMVLRGIGFVWILATDRAESKLDALVSDAVDENWKETWYTCLFSFPAPEEEGVAVHSHHFVEPLVEYNQGSEIQPGQLVITGAQEFYLGQEYLLPVPELAGQAIRVWEEFKKANEDYLLGQLYPDSYYFLFGGWLRYGTLSQYEFPCHYIYYRSR